MVIAGPGRAGEFAGQGLRCGVSMIVTASKREDLAHPARVRRRLGAATSALARWPQSAAILRRPQLSHPGPTVPWTAGRRARSDRFPVRAARSDSAAVRRAALTSTVSLSRASRTTRAEVAGGVINEFYQAA